MPCLAKWLSVRLRTNLLRVLILLLTFKLQIWCLLRASSSMTFSQNVVYGFTLKLVRDMTITYNQMHRKGKYSTAELSHFATFFKSFSVPLRTKWFSILTFFLSLKLQILHLLRVRSSLTFNQTVVCVFTLKLVRDMITPYSHIHRRDKYSNTDQLFSQFG